MSISDNQPECSVLFFNTPVSSGMDSLGMSFSTGNTNIDVWAVERGRFDSIRGAVAIGRSRSIGFWLHPDYIPDPTVT